MQPAALLHLVRDGDVGAASGHVGGHGDGAGPAGARDDGGLLGVLPGVQHHMLDAGPIQQRRQRVGIAHRFGGDQHRAATADFLSRPFDGPRPFPFRSGMEDRRHGAASAGAVKRYRHHRQRVERQQLAARLAQCCAGAAEAQIARKEALESDPRHRLEGVAERTALLQLDELVQPLRPLPPFGNATGGGVDDVDLVVAHQIVTIAFIAVQRHQRLRHRAALETSDPPEPGQVAAAIADRRSAERCQRDLATVRDAAVVQSLVEAAGDLHGLPVVGLGHAAGALARQDQRRRRLVEENAVRLVDQRQAEAAQYRLAAVATAVAESRQPVMEVVAVFAPGQAVAQVVEHQLLAGAVDDVAGVFVTPLLRVEFGGDGAGSQPDARGDGAQLLGIANDEEIVGGDDMDRNAGQRSRQRGYEGGQRLALARMHLGQPPVEHHQRGADLVAVAQQSGFATHQFAGDGDRIEQRRMPQAVLSQQCRGPLGGALQPAVVQPGEPLFAFEHRVGLAQVMARAPAAETVKQLQAHCPQMHPQPLGRVVALGIDAVDQSRRGNGRAAHPLLPRWFRKSCFQRSIHCVSRGSRPWSKRSQARSPTRLT